MSGAEGTIAEVLAGTARWCVVEGDCLDVLPTLPPDKGTLVATDPPWGVDLKTKNASKGLSDGCHTWASVDHAPCIGDDQAFDPKPLLRFANVIAWGANHYASRLPDSSCWLAWDRKTERVVGTFATDGELAWTLGLPFKTTRWFRHMWAGYQRDSEVGQKVLHPMQKPIALYTWCLGFFPKCDLVVDPYLGSAPCGVAALRLGRRFIGIEKDPGYAAIARERLRAEVDSSTLQAVRAGQVPMFGAKVMAKKARP